MCRLNVFLWESTHVILPGHAHLSVFILWDLEQDWIQCINCARGVFFLWLEEICGVFVVVRESSWCGRCFQSAGTLMWHWTGCWFLWWITASVFLCEHINRTCVCYPLSCRLTLQSIFHDSSYKEGTDFHFKMVFFSFSHPTVQRKNTFVIYGLFSRFKDR